VVEGAHCRIAKTCFTRGDRELRRGAHGDVLAMPDGRRIAIPHLPEVLSGADGKRVWIAGPIDAPTGAGVIDPARRYSFLE
jgi:hypothetical protein